MNHSTETLAAALRAAGHPLYSDRRSDAASRAMDCLSGRTHYVDPDTRRFFRARVLSSRVLCDGLFFGIVESASADHAHTSRCFRGVVFDIFGTVVYRPNLDDSFRTRAAAEKDFWRAVDALNPADYYRAVLTARAKKLHREAIGLMETVISMGA